MWFSNLSFMISIKNPSTCKNIRQYKVSYVIGAQKKCSTEIKLWAEK
jgi:hypothetical protein